MAKSTLKLIPLEIGQVIDLKIDSMAYDNAAIARYKEFVVMVDRGAPGDEVKAEVTLLRPGYARAKIIEIIKSDIEYRLEPECKIFKVCGGCQWQHLHYEKQLEQKDLLLKGFFNKLDLEEGILKNVIEGNLWNYRNKVQYPVRTVKDTGRLKAGYFEWHSRDLVNVKYCPIQEELFDPIIETVRSLSPKYRITAYDGATGKGWLRHISVRSGRNKNGKIGLLLTLIVVSEAFPQGIDLATEVMEKHPELVGVCFNINRNTTNVIYGDKTKVIKGRGYLYETVNNITFKISATSFFQVNTPQTEKMLNVISDYAALNGSETVLDAYCGVGLIAISLAKKAKQVIGIEEVRQSIDDANCTAADNKLENFTFITGKVENKIHEALAKFNPEVVILDPPRVGCNKVVIESILRSDVKKIIYTSCNPATLVRDLVLLKEKYKIKSIQPIDMFPHTYHIENVVLLESS